MRILCVSQEKNCQFPLTKQGRGGQMGGQKFGGGGGPAPWGAPSPWQQQPQRQQASGNWGNPWGQQGKFIFYFVYM